MAKTIRCIEVRSADNKLIFSLRVYDEFAVAGDGAKPLSSQSSQGANAKDRDGNGQKDAKDGNAITDAQKRYLFRILADQGLEGDAALARLKERLGVQALNDASKREASALIEELLSNSAAK